MKKLFFTLALAAVAFCGFAQNPVIDPLLADEMNNRSDDEKINVVVIMKERYDRDMLNRRADYFVTRAQRREFVVNELKEFTAASQYDLKRTLAEMKHNDMVTEQRTLWMSNALCFGATKAAIRDLAMRNDIEVVGYNIERNWIPETDQPRPASSTREITPNVIQVGADQVWALGFTGEGVVVAVIDTGVNYNHLDLADHLWDGGLEFPHHGYDVYNNDNDPMDDHSHGTHCAGTVCGDGTAGSQTGMAPDATLMCVKCLSSSGNGGADAISAGIEWAVEHGADMFSMSLGVPNSSIAERTLLRRTCASALDAGVVAAIAAGNEGNSQNQYPIPNNVRVPGSCPPPYMDEVQDQNAGELCCGVTIGAVDYDDSAAYFSSHGPTTWTNTEFGDYPYNPGIGLIRPDVCAPGVDIKSADYSNNTGYQTMSGTSMATPCAAGCMALMLSKNIDLAPADVCRILEETAFPLAATKNNITGFGRINVLAAIEEVQMGSLAMETYVINDPLGNNDHKLNPGETVSLGMNVTNLKEETVSGATLELSTNDGDVTIINGTAQLPTFSANQTLFLEDIFSFQVNNSVEGNQRIHFVAQVMQAGEPAGRFTFSIPVYDYNLQFGAIAVLNDDNNNGFLEAGETADLRIFVDNQGNEMAPVLSGTLGSTYPYLTINGTEQSFGTIGGNLSGFADFNVTLSASAPEGNDIPFSLELVDGEGRQTSMSFDYRISCNVVFSLTDSWGDGWNNAYLTVEYSDGTPTENMTINSGNSASYTRQLSTNSTVTLTWHSGNYDSECSFSVAYQNGATILEHSGGMSSPYTFTVNCSGGEVNETCAPVRDLTYLVDGHDVVLAWEAPEEGQPAYYLVYRGTLLLSQVEALGYTDANVEDGGYNYCVQAVFANCQGAMACEWVEVLGCSGVQNLTHVMDSDLHISLSWEDPQDTSGLIEYQVFLDDVLLGSTLEHSYDYDMVPGEHDFNVKAVFEDCENDTFMHVCILPAVENLHYVGDGNHADVAWDALAGASQYEVYLNGELAATVDETNYEVELENDLTTVMVKPVADGCYVLENSIEICYINAVENLQFISMDDNGTLHFTWDAVESAEYYSVTANGATEQVAETEFAFMGEIGSNDICVTAHSVYGCAAETTCMSGITVCSPVDGFDYSFNGNEVTVTWNGEGISQNEVVLDGESQIVYENRLVAQVENGMHTIKVTPAYDEECWAVLSATFDFEVTNVAPEIRITDVRQGHMSTAWNAVAGAIAYNLFRDGELIADGLTATEYNDTEMAIDMQHCYTVQAVYAKGVSTLSNEACANYFNGIDENGGQVSIFPNPTTDKVTVECAGMSQIDIYNVEGKLIDSFQVENDSYQIDGLENGIYMLRIRKGDAVFVSRLVKM
ncbi:MAG: S8 family serine peptidase [Bacteroidales bacterium]|nr:S8 family serine peptidase [Bacteroidales bacterium]